MDPFAHTFAGAALAGSGLRKTTPLATAALLIGVNAPDMDILVSYLGEYMSLAHRRGWSHGILAWVLLPLLLTGSLLCWDSLVRRRLYPDALPANGRCLLALSALAVLTHPALDWLNNYGIRLLMPFDDRWFYGDALFIIDPWLWLTLGGAVFLLWSRSWPAVLGWGLFWAAASWLVAGNGMVPAASQWYWFIGLSVLALLRLTLPMRLTPRYCQLALLVAACYILTCTVASRQGSIQVKDIAAEQGVEVEDLMVGPMPANPFRGAVIIESADSYRLGQWRWLDEPRLTLSPQSVAKNLSDPRAVAAMEAPYARRFLIWSRFPLATIDATPSGWRVRFSDARYGGRDGGVGGPTIDLNSKLEVIAQF